MTLAVKCEVGGRPDCVRPQSVLMCSSVCRSSFTLYFIIYGFLNPLTSPPPPHHLKKTISLSC